MRILEQIEVHQGQASPTINLGVSGVDSLDGYTCEMRVIDRSGHEVISTREVIERNMEGIKESFALNLKSTDTQSLTVGSLYIWVIHITNDLVFFKDEIRIGVLIKEHGKY